MEKKMGKRRRFTAEEKFSMVKELLSKTKTVSQICEEYGIYPNQVYYWQKQFFENALNGFQESSEGRTHAAEERKVKTLENEIRIRDEVISKLVQENIASKKKST